MTLSLDIGGTNIRSAIVNKTKLADYRKTPTPKKKQDILKKIIEIISQYKKQTICIAVAGFERNGVIQHSLNTDINGVALSSLLRKKFKVPVFIENDANCAGLAELHYGAGKNLNNFVLLTLGTGIGGAVIINKKLYRGNGGAGEIGSIYLKDKTIFEHLASGDASVALAHKQGFKNITSLELEHLANKGNKKAKEVYNKIGENLGIGLANISYILDPDAILLGGGFSRVKHIYAPAQKALNKFYNITPKPKLLKARFGDDAGLIGAALLSKKQ